MFIHDKALIDIRFIFYVMYNETCAVTKCYITVSQRVVVVSVVIRLSVLCFVLLLAIVAKADEYHKVVHLDTDSGLSQGTINQLIQDKKGYIWALNENGVDIFDGYRFRSFKGPDDFFADDIAQDILQDTNSNIWLVLENKGLVFFNPETNDYRSVYVPSNSYDDYIISIALADNNKLLMLTSTSLLSVDVNSYQVTQLAELSGKFQTSYAVLSFLVHDNTAIIGTKEGLYLYDLAESTLVKLPLVLPNKSSDQKLILEANKIYRLIIDSEDTLYIGTNRGIYSANFHALKQVAGSDESFAYHQIESSASVWDFHLLDNSLYVATEQGLYAYRLNSNRIELVTTANQLSDKISDERVIHVSSDHLGRLWLSTSSRGLLVLSKPSAAIDNTVYSRNTINSLPVGDVWGFQQSPTNSDELWIGTSYGLTKKNLQTNAYRHYYQDLTDNYMYGENHVYQLTFINQDELLVATGYNSYLLNTQSGYVDFFDNSPEIKSLLNGDYNQLFFDENNIGWYTSRDEIVVLDFNRRAIVKRYQFEEKGLKGNLGYFLQKLDDHHVLFSSGNALYTLNVDTEKAIKVYDNAGVSGAEWSPFINSYIDEYNQLWLATYGDGIIVLDASSYELITEINYKNHDINNNVYGLIADSAGDIWFSSHNGIYSIEPKTKELRHFNELDGLVGKEFNLGAVLKLTNGLMAFGSTAGFSLVDPILLKKLSEEKQIFDVQISNFQVLSTEKAFPLYTPQNITVPLNYDDVGVRIEFTDFDFLNMGEQKYVFELQGPEPIKFPATKDNFVVFPRLASGKHTLKVTSMSPDSGVESKPLNIHFNVSYAPWSSPLAYTLYTIVVLTLLSVTIYRRRLRQLALLKAHEEVKYRENRLQLALKGSNSDVWDWQAGDNMLFSERINQELGYRYAESAYQFSQHLDLIHAEDKAEFLSAWQKFLQRADLNENFACTYRLKAENGDWLWFKDLGKIVSLDQRGKPSRVTGSYTNITETRADEERAQYYGAAFAQTKDWVVILNHELTKITANQAIRDVFGWEQEDLPIAKFAATLPPTKRQHYIELIQALSPGESWRGDELVTIEGGKEYHVLINITVGVSQHDKQQHYVCLITDITAQKNAEQELRYMANYDHLTGLPNRTLLLDRIEHAMTVVQRHKSEMALLFIDLDRFKQVNDSLGHDYGDMLLKVVTERLKNALRTEDTIARLGGDEFVVLIENYEQMKDVARIAQSIIDCLAQPFTLIEHIVTIGASIGIAIYPFNADDSAELLRSADIAMYHAKQNGRNHFQFFTVQMNEQVAERVKQETRLKFALAESQFVNYYQPIVDAQNEKSVGVELLLRWPTKDGMISPIQFIPMAEELGLIGEMTVKSLTKGLEHVKAWRQIVPDFYLSLNVSAVHFNDKELIRQIRCLLEKFDLPARALKIEITESALIKEPDKVTETMNELNQMGIELALDDFGTGYSSLGYLKQLPLDIIKVDRSFTAGIGEDPTDQAIVDATLVLANSLNKRCIAEGVETQLQLDYLTNLGCRYIQGYLFSKPVPAQDIGDRLAQEYKDA